MVEPQGERRRDWAWFLLVAIASSAWCVSAASRLGLTYDERFYIEDGNQGWLDSSNIRLITNGTMPLPVEVHTSVLYAWRGLAEAGVASIPPDPAWDVLRALPYCRFMNLIFWWILLWHVQALGGLLGGSWAGRLALIFVAADPTMLAHASLATTDTSLAAACVALVHSVIAGRTRGAVRRIVLPGFWLGVAASCKVSGLVYGLIALGLVEAIALAAAPRLSFQTFGRITAITLIGLSLMLAYTGFRNDHLAMQAVVDYVQRTNPKSETLPRLESWNQWPTPIPNALPVFAFQYAQNHHGRPAYLLGKIYVSGWLYYFPVLLLLKLPAVIVLLGVAVTATRPGAWMTSAALLALVWLLAAMPSRVQIGVRLVLPVIAMGYVALALAMVRGWGNTGKNIGLAAGALLAGSVLWVWPNGLSYDNGLADVGPERFHLFTDSNLDWGQGLPELERWHRHHDRPTLAVWYFGRDPRIQWPTFREAILYRSSAASLEELKAELGTPFLAVSTTALTDHHISHLSAPAERVVLQLILTHEPFDRTSTFLIYNLDNAPLREAPIPAPIEVRSRD